MPATPWQKHQQSLNASPSKDSLEDARSGTQGLTPWQRHQLSLKQAKGGERQSPIQDGNRGHDTSSRRAGHREKSIESNRAPSENGHNMLGALKHHLHLDRGRNHSSNDVPKKASGGENLEPQVAPEEDDSQHAFNKTAKTLERSAAGGMRSAETQFAHMADEGHAYLDKMSKRLEPELKHVEEEGEQLLNGYFGKAGNMAHALQDKMTIFVHHDHHHHHYHHQDTGDEAQIASPESASTRASTAIQQSCKQSNQQNGGSHHFFRQALPSDTGPPDLMKAVLAAHNVFRSKHGAPPLEWSDTCYQSAKMQAKLCQSKQKMFHGNLGDDHEMGQNIFYRSPAYSRFVDAINAAVEDWYGEVEKPSYDFKLEGNQKHTGHFTQLVWNSTTSVGMAISDDGFYIVANYLPAGNIHGQFLANVFPKGGKRA